MKKLLLLFALLPGFAWAQLKVKDCAPGYLASVAKYAQAARMDETQLLAAKPALLPVNFTDTLKKYDWYDLNSYAFSTKEFFDPWGTVYAGPVDLQYDFLRFDSDSTINHMYLHFNNREDMPKEEIYTNTFDRHTAEKLASLKTAGGATYLSTIAYGETEYQKIISYKNGVLIKELTKNGKIGEKPVMYRIAYMAVPKG